MRLLILTPVLALSLAACGKSDDSEGQNAERALTAEAISTNDVTAIDAVTGEAANIAADVELTVEMNNAAGGAAGNGPAASRRSQRGAAPTSPAANTAAPAAEPAAPADPQSNAQ